MSKTAENRALLVVRVQAALKLPKARQAEKLLDAVVEAIAGVLADNIDNNGFVLKLRGLGKFTIRHRQGSMRRIPFNGTTILTFDKRKVKYNPLGKLKALEVVRTTPKTQTAKNSN